jgi:hypothetical protein
MRVRADWQGSRQNLAALTATGEQEIRRDLSL